MVMGSAAHSAEYQRVKYDEFLPHVMRLPGAKGNAGGPIKARCPAHDDAHASLSLHPLYGLTCFTGCAFKDILSALGIEPRNPNGGERKPIPIHRGRADMGEPTVTYEYRDEGGALVAIKGRWDFPNGKKTFQWRLPQGEWDDGLDGLQQRDLPLYGAEQLAAADPSITVWFNEGEKGKDACAAHGLLAVSHGGGAAVKDFGEKLAILRGRNVAIVQDNDQPGRAFVEVLQSALKPIAQSVHGVLLPVPEKGDAYDYFTTGGTAANAERIYSDKTRGISSESILLPFCTARQTADDTPDQTEWVVPGYLARGCITEMDGKMKLAGKTTFTTYMCAAILDGKPFLGRNTEKTSVVYLSEQPPASFREALRRADLLERDDLHILYKHKTMGLAWEDIAKQSAQYAASVGAGVMIVDTLAPFAGMKGDDENSAGAALAAIEPLSLAASSHRLAVMILRHERKSGGEVGDSARGSSAFGGAVDIIFQLRRAEGKMRPSIRKLSAISRFDETPTDFAVELTDTGYKPLEDQGAIALKEAKRAIYRKAPVGEDGALNAADLCAAAELKYGGTEKTALKELRAEGWLWCTGTGHRGDPQRWYRKPLKDRRDKEFYSAKTIENEVLAESIPPNLRDDAVTPKGSPTYSDESSDTLVSSEYIYIPAGEPEFEMASSELPF